MTRARDPPPGQYVKMRAAVRSAYFSRATRTGKIVRRAVRGCCSGAGVAWRRAASVSVCRLGLRRLCYLIRVSATAVLEGWLYVAAAAATPENCYTYTRNRDVSPRRVPSRRPKNTASRQNILRPPPRYFPGVRTRQRSAHTCTHVWRELPRLGQCAFT